MLKLAGLVLLAWAVHAADFQACPAHIDVQPQQLAAAVPGWMAAQADGPGHELWYVKVYDGDPKEKADLVPDSNEPLKRGWDLSPHGRPYWLECHYTRTTVVLRHPLPNNLKSCVVTMRPGVSLDGEPVIKAIVCR